jgi:hypothetical protein
MESSPPNVPGLGQRFNPDDVLNDYGEFGIAYEEADPAETDCETIIRIF